MIGHVHIRVSAAFPAPAAALAGVDADAIIVTGTSIEQTLPQGLARYGNDLDILTGGMVRDRGAVDLATALDAVPGLYVRPGSGPFSYVDLSLQGSRTADVLWTVDGGLSRIRRDLSGWRGRRRRSAAARLAVTA